MNNHYEYIKQLTLDLVKIPSMVRTEEEKKFEPFLVEKLAGIEYFKENPDNLFTVPLEDDSLNRACVFALVEGPSTKKKDTVILLSHYDTVDIDDYGELAQYALDPYTLQEKMKKYKFNDDVWKDLNSPDWLFGRGALDMKSGIAQHIWLLGRITNEIEKLDGNVLFICVPDEEAMAKGSHAAVQKLLEIKKERQFDFIGLVNTDYTAPRYQDDPNKYGYFGTIGKYLLSFFVGGLATHAGECLEGLDANLIVSKIVSRISMNCDFCDEVDGEITPAPVTLKQADLKEVYNVQIPYESYANFNFFTFTKSPEEILELAKNEAKNVMKNLADEVNGQKEFFCKKSGIPYNPTEIKLNVYTYDEFYNKVMEENDKVEGIIEQIIRDYKLDEADETKLSLEVVHRLFKESNEFHENTPCIIVYFSPPYVPRVHVKNESESEKRFRGAVAKAVQAEDHSIILKNFFPYISDMSWYGMSDDVKDINKIKANTPGFYRTCSIDLESITTLNIPCLNIGPHGKDAHEATERLYMPYSFGSVPEVLEKIVKNLIYQCQ